MSTAAGSKNILEMYKESPTWAKGVIDLFILGTIAVGAYAIVKGVRKFKDSRTSDQVANSSHGTYQDLLNSGQTLTFPDSSYMAAANTIQNLLDGCELPSSEAQVIQEIEKVVKKPIDWYKLVSVFGSRVLDNCGPWTGSTTYDLITLIKDQVGDLYLPYLTEYLGKMHISI